MNRFSFAALLTVPLLALFAQVQIPERSATALFKGEPGRQRTEIRFDPASGVVLVYLTNRLAASGLSARQQCQVSDAVRTACT